MQNHGVIRNVVAPLILRLALAAIFIFHGWHKIADKGNEWGGLWAKNMNDERLFLPKDVEAQLQRWDDAHPPNEGNIGLSEKAKLAYSQLAGPEFAKQRDEGAIHLGAAAQVLVAWGEFLGGIAMLLGLLTRVAAAGLIVIQVGAIVLVTGAQGFSAGAGGGYEYNVALIGMFLVLLLTGGGTVSLDRLMRRPRRAAAPPQRAVTTAPAVTTPA
jgi:uncharacterized membrane protein YphA (DoxX/SURF4 family)